MFKDVLVLGSGSAGLLIALAIKRQMPAITVRILRSPEIGTIGVGESTTPNVPRFLFDYLGLDRRRFYQMAEPTWKLGIHFLWGPRESFQYPFNYQLDARVNLLPRPNGYYCDEQFEAVNLASALMSAGKAFPRQANGMPDLGLGHAFHLENAKFVATLEQFARAFGVEFIDGTFASGVPGPDGISSIVLQDGRTLSADFYVDASGFRREILGGAFKEPFVDFSDTLFNDRAILGSWERGPDENILPYTTAQTMDHGWSWRIDHEQTINRGYVFSSKLSTEEQVRAEFAAANPKAKINDRLVKFKTGRFDRCWVGNVLAVGNSAGFVEPLEATALMIICWQCQSFCDMVKHAGPTPAVRDLFNKLSANVWDETRDFLSLHFLLNTRLDTPYWKHCRAETATARVKDILDFYQDAGPTGYGRYHLSNNESQFGVEGYLVQFVGNKVPYRNRHTATAEEWRLVNQLRSEHRQAARRGFTVKETLGFIRHPDWRWFYEQQAQTAPTSPQTPRTLAASAT